MLVVETNPLQDREFNTGDYGVSAYIDDRSETGLLTDSLLVYWRLEGAMDFDAVTLLAAAYPDSYHAEIPMQDDSLNIEYYVLARDMSGRRSTRPPVAPDSWYTFNTGAPDVSAVSGQVAATASGLVMAHNRPNPFRQSTSIEYNLQSGGRVELDIFDVTGRHVVKLFDGYRARGEWVAHWDGMSAAGGRLPGGVYYCRLRSGHSVVTRAMVLLD
jgi:hypothetical protein